MKKDIWQDYRVTQREWESSWAREDRFTSQPLRDPYNERCYIPHATWTPYHYHEIPFLNCGPMPTAEDQSNPDFKYYSSTSVEWRGRDSRNVLQRFPSHIDNRNEAWDLARRIMDGEFGPLDAMFQDGQGITHYQLMVSLLATAWAVKIWSFENHEPIYAPSRVMALVPSDHYEQGTNLMIGNNVFISWLPGWLDRRKKTKKCDRAENLQPSR